jgi:hypothetical protein
LKPCEPHIGLSLLLFSKVDEENEDLKLELINKIQDSIIKLGNQCTRFKIQGPFSPPKTWLWKAYELATTECERFMLDAFSACCEEEKGMGSTTLIPQRKNDVIQWKSCTLLAFCDKFQEKYSKGNMNYHPTL